MYLIKSFIIAKKINRRNFIIKENIKYYYSKYKV